MNTQQIVEHCTTELKMSIPEARWVAENLYDYELPDWSEWTQWEIDECLRSVLRFRDKTQDRIRQEMECAF